MSFLPRRPAETPAPVRPNFDSGIIACIEDALDECLGHLPIHSYLIAVIEADERFSARLNLQRAAEYARGRIEWRLGIGARRPPRGWKEGQGSRSLAASTYLALDDLADRALDTWAGLGLAINPARAVGDLATSHGEDELRAAIERHRREIREGQSVTRGRLSVLAA